MLSYLNEYVFGPILPLLLIIVGAILFFRFGYLILFHPIRCFRSLFFSKDRSQRTASLRSMITALAGTLGVGNITGVACAITAGGAGALFWMWVSALFAMIVKYAEILLACRYKTRGDDGKLHGGAFLYIKNGCHRPRLAKGFALLLILSSFTVGNMTQTSAAAETVQAFFSLPRIFSGILLSLLLVFILLGGGERIVSFANRLIPPLTLLYILLSLGIILGNLPLIPSVFQSIFKDAFTPRAGIGGVSGYLLMSSLRLGTARGILSNEAGCGTAPTAHACASANAAQQGLYGILEVFVDTILLCTLTGIVVLLSLPHLSGLDGTALAISSFSFYLGDWAEWVLALSVLLYALASTVAWGYYAIEALSFLCKKKTAEKYYRLFYGLACLLGAICPMAWIMDISDATICLMCLINLICVLCLSGQIRKETKSYFAKKRRC